MQLVFVALRSSATLHIAHVGLLVGHNQRTFKLACASGIDAEIARKLHGAAHPFGNIAERPIAKHSRIQRGKEVVAYRHHRPKVLLHKVGVLLHRLTNGAEQDTLLLQHLLRGSLHRHRVHNSIVCHASQLFLFAQRDTQFVERSQQLGVHLVKALLQLALLWCGVIDDILIVHLVVLQVRPIGFLHRLPFTESLQTKLQQPVGLVLFLRDKTHHVLVKAFSDGVCVDIGHKAPFILFVCNLLNYTIVIFSHNKVCSIK